jgi:hypothetical protein
MYCCNNIKSSLNDELIETFEIPNSKSADNFFSNLYKIFPVILFAILMYFAMSYDNPNSNTPSYFQLNSTTTNSQNNLINRTSNYVYFNAIFGLIMIIYTLIYLIPNTVMCGLTDIGNSKKKFCVTSLFIFFISLTLIVVAYYFSLKTNIGINVFVNLGLEFLAGCYLVLNIISNVNISTAALFCSLICLAILTGPAQAGLFNYNRCIMNEVSYLVSQNSINGGNLDGLKNIANSNCPIHYIEMSSIFLTGLTPLFSYIIIRITKTDFIVSKNNHRLSLRYLTELIVLLTIEWIQITYILAISMMINGELIFATVDQNTAQLNYILMACTIICLNFDLVSNITIGGENIVIPVPSAPPMETAPYQSL